METEPDYFRYDEVTRKHCHCPNCYSVIYHKTPTACPGCLFSLASLKQVLNFTSPEIKEIMDFENRLSVKDNSAIKKAFAKLISLYPDLSISLCYLEISPQLKLSVFGFWMLNQSITQTNLHKRANTILIIYDPQHNNFSITKGLALDPYLPDEDFDPVIPEILSQFDSGHDLKAIQSILKRIKLSLEDSRKHVKKISKLLND